MDRSPVKAGRYRRCQLYYYRQLP